MGVARFAGLIRLLGPILPIGFISPTNGLFCLFAVVVSVLNIGIEHLAKTKFVARLVKLKARLQRRAYEDCEEDIENLFHGSVILWFSCLVI